MSAQACASTSVREEVVIWPVCSHCERKTSVVGWGISPKVGRKQDYLAICPQHGAIPTWLGESSTPRRQHPVSAGPAAADPKANRGPMFFLVPVAARAVAILAIEWPCGPVTTDPPWLGSDGKGPTGPPFPRLPGTCHPMERANNIPAPALRPASLAVAVGPSCMR